MSILLEPYPSGTVGYLAFPEQKQFLISELRERFFLTEKDILKSHVAENLFLFTPDMLPSELTGPKPETVPYWSSTVLLNPQKANFNSIGEAAGLLKEIQRNWAPYTFTQFRRTALIQEKLPYINVKPRQFPFKVHDTPVGLYCLLDTNNMILSGDCTSFYPQGLIQFVEDHENPPSRAYLKLQEALIHAQNFFHVFPQPEQRIFDAGACPGGWTWVLLQLGCSVFAVDRSPLADSLMSSPKVEFLKHDAFTLLPQDIGPFAWVCSDVICYPQRLLHWIHLWLDSGMCNNMVCTIKMQGKIDWPLIAEFATIKHSKVLHLHYNKHELTWIYHKETEPTQNVIDTL